MPALLNGKYAAPYGRNGDGSFYAYVTYENSVCPGFGMRSFKTLASAKKGAETMLAKAA
jgi:hypothetical protein